MKCNGPLTLLFVPALLAASAPFSAAGYPVQYTKAVAEWNQPVKPFHIIGNIYYVGATEVSSFLITTPSGHILLDSGFAETVPMILKNIVELGFSAKDVKVLINSHAHYDHAGGLAELKRVTGARLALSGHDASIRRLFSVGSTPIAPRCEPLPAVPRTAFSTRDDPFDCRQSECGCAFAAVRGLRLS